MFTVSQSFKRAICAGLCVLTLATSFATAPTKRVIGKLGQSLDKTTIYRSMSRKGKVMSQVEAFKYLVVNPTNDDEWLAVAMSDGSTGYVRTELVAQLPYEVTKDGDKAPEIPGGQNLSQPSDDKAGAKQVAIQESFKYLGTPYKWGGENLNSGIDCSAFIMKLYRQVGISLPRTAAEQARVGMKVERLEDLKPGDRLYFWSSKRNMIGHTGIFLGFFADGGAYFIHSSSNNRGVATDDLRSAKWRRILVDARRD